MRGQTAGWSLSSEDGHAYQLGSRGEPTLGRAAPDESRALYRCRHHVVTAGGESCYICGLDLEGTSWYREWRKRGHHAARRPLPTEYGIGRVTL